MYREHVPRTCSRWNCTENKYERPVHCNCKLWEVCSCYQGLTESKAMTSDALRNGLAASPNHTLEAKISVPFPFWPWCLFGCPVHRKKVAAVWLPFLNGIGCPKGAKAFYPFPKAALLYNGSASEFLIRGRCYGPCGHTCTCTCKY